MPKITERKNWVRFICLAGAVAVARPPLKTDETEGWIVDIDGTREEFQTWKGANKSVVNPEDMTVERDGEGVPVRIRHVSGLHWRISALATPVVEAVAELNSKPVDYETAEVGLVFAADNVPKFMIERAHCYIKGGPVDGAFMRWANEIARLTVLGAFS